MKNALRLAVVVAILALAFFLINQSNFIENTFTSLDEVKAARPGARAGVPDWLPASATGIVHVHNLDTWKSMVRFDMPENTAVAVPDQCRRIQASQLPAPPMSRDWWPKDIAHAAQSFFQCPNGQFVALSRTAGYIWGTPLR